MLFAMKCQIKSAMTAYNKPIGNDISSALNVLHEISLVNKCALFVNLTISVKNNNKKTLFG